MLSKVKGQKPDVMVTIRERMFSLIRPFFLSKPSASQVKLSHPGEGPWLYPTRSFNARLIHIHKPRVCLTADLCTLRSRQVHTSINPPIQEPGV